MDKLRAGFALLFVALFAIAWVYIGWKLWHFTPTKTKKTLDLSNDLVDVAGFLASTVAAGTAAVLGVKIQTRRGNGDSGVSADRRGRRRLVAHTTAVGKAAKTSILLVIGIAVYAIVGLFVGTIWITHAEQAPDMIRAFSWGVIGWLAGSYVAIYHE